MNYMLTCPLTKIFDMSSLTIYAGPKGIEVGQELTFFYPSTEWDMAQGFECICGTATCRGCKSFVLFLYFRIMISSTAFFHICEPLARSCWIVYTWYKPTPLLFLVVYYS